MLPLLLARPLVCLDVESTGTSPSTDRIIELALVRLDTAGTRTRQRWLLHPGCPIPPAAIRALLRLRAGTHQEIASLFGVNRKTIWFIERGERWPHVQ